MNLTEWRKNPERRSMALDILNQSTLREMLAVMEVEHPAKQLNVPLRDGFDATIELGRIRGFQEALSMLQSFGEPLPQPMQDVPITWNPDNETKPK